MNEAVRESLCTNCLHREVCMHKDKYLTINNNLIEIFTDIATCHLCSDIFTFKDVSCSKFVDKAEVALIAKK